MFGLHFTRSLLGTRDRYILYRLTSAYCTGAVLEQNIGGGARQKVDDFLVVTPTLQKRSLYNCLLVLLLHTSAVSKDLGGQGSGWGAIAPLSHRKTAPGTARAILL